jgi:hypothetical protein
VTTRRPGRSYYERVLALFPEIYAPPPSSVRQLAESVLVYGWGMGR